MLGSISPVGEASRNQRWWLTVSAYVTASAGAGATVGLVLGGAGEVLFGWATPQARMGALGVLTVAAAAMDGGVFGRAIPSWHRQVDERWLTTYRGWVYGAGYGAQLGTAVATIVTSAVTYAALAAALLSASWRAGLAVGTTFGAARAVPLLLMGRVGTAERLHVVTRRVADAQPWARRLAIGAQGVLAAAAVTMAVLR